MHHSASRSTDGESCSHTNHSLHRTPSRSALQVADPRWGHVHHKRYHLGQAALHGELERYALGVSHGGHGDDPLEPIAVREVPDPGVGALANGLVSLGRVSEEASMQHATASAS
jgi:hypothetical protein